MRIQLLSIAFLSAILPAAAVEPPYLDDRSNPSSLIESLYNAISRKEYARAWSYFSEKPAASLDVYAEGYADTASVRVAVGLPSAHGAAGTTHYYVPVAIEASAEGGDYQVYGGCYELKLANPQIQGEDFTPLEIVAGNLSSATGSLASALPQTCDDLGAPDPALIFERRATALFHDAFPHCDIPPNTSADEALITYVARFKYSHSTGNDDAEEERRIYQFLCGRGAYNEGHVYIMGDENGEMSALSFATPELDIRYEDSEHAKVESVNIIGFRTEQELVNSFFDEKTLTITSYAKWRGVGDASSTGIWILRDGEFTLTRYDVDASYDGELNQETVLDYHSGP